MPGLDKTGPTGQGSRTGRRMGNCKTENVSEELGRGRGLGRRRGLGRGIRLENLETSVFAEFARRVRGGGGRGLGRQD